MVSPVDGEKRDAPEYSLDAVRRLAGFGQIEFRGKKVRTDVASLGFGLEDVCLCLQSLQTHHFAHAIWYASIGRWHDVYKPQYRVPDGRELDLYIKLRIDHNCVTIELCSFHE